MITKPKAVIFGLGKNYENIKVKLFEKYDVIALSDNNKSKHGQVTDGFKVVSPEEIPHIEFDKIFITPADIISKKIREQLKNLGIESCKMTSTPPITSYFDIFGTYTRPEGEKLISSVCRPSDLDELLPKWEQLKNQKRDESSLANTAGNYNRKIWEFVYICQALYERGALKSGARGLGFAVGSEPLPSVFADFECKITATDAPIEVVGKAWRKGNQHADRLDELYHPGIVSKQKFLENTEYRPLDMKHIPYSEQGYDFIWSACALEHLGSVFDGKDFIYRAMDCLKPGGTAVHTTEINLLSSVDTDSFTGSVMLRSTDFIEIAEHLFRQGHSIEPLDFRLMDFDDFSYEVPPYENEHFKLLINNFVTTSFGLIIRKKE